MHMWDGAIVCREARSHTVHDIVASKSGSVKKKGDSRNESNCCCIREMIRRLYPSEGIETWVAKQCFVVVFVLGVKKPVAIRKTVRHGAQLVRVV